MLITTCMISLIMFVIWKRSLWSICLFLIVFISVEGTYLSSVLYKFADGGYFPLALSCFLMFVMGIWHFVHIQRYMFELNNTVPSSYLMTLADNPKINRVPGVCLLYSEFVQGIPPIFRHFVSNIPSIHSVLIFVSIKHIPISNVALAERFLFRQVEPKEHRMFTCVVRYGYKDSMEEPQVFEKQLIGYLNEFVRPEHLILESETQFPDVNPDHSTLLVADGGRVQEKEIYPESDKPDVRTSSISIRSVPSSNRMTVSGLIQGAEEEVQFLQRAAENGIIYLLGESEVVATQKSSVFKKVIVNYAYSFLRKNFRQGDKVMAIPKDRLLRVGMTYEI